MNGRPAVYEKLLVGTDGSETAQRAVARAVEVARATGARLLVAFAGDREQGLGALAGVESAYADAGVELTTHLLTGDPADALLGFGQTEAVDCIVVGSKGMSGAQRFLLGSVPNKVSHRARCDVLIVHTTGE